MFKYLQKVDRHVGEQEEGSGWGSHVIDTHDDIDMDPCLSIIVSVISMKYLNIEVMNGGTLPFNSQS